MKKEHDLKRLTRIVKLLNTLSSGKLVISEAAIDNDVSTRTIQRDIRTIEDAGFFIYPERPGQFRFMEGVSLRKAQLTAEEASMLVLIADIVKPLGKNFEKSFDLLKNKVFSGVAESPYYVKMPKTKEFPKNEVTDKIAQAIVDKEKIKLKYWKDGKLLEYDASPLRIVNFEGFWYLVCLNISRNFRTHRLAKFVSCETTGKFFKPPKALEKYLKESRNAWAEFKRDKRVVLKISGDVAYYFREKEYFPLQKIIKEHKDGSITIEAYVSNYQEVTPIIISWVPHMQILLPEELKEKIFAMLKQIKI